MFLMVAFVRYLQKHNIVLRCVYILLRCLAVFLIVRYSLYLKRSQILPLTNDSASYYHRRAPVSQLPKINLVPFFSTCL